jgi:hypothetical protein
MGCNNNNTGCVDQFNCSSNVIPDFAIKRHDTNPAFEVIIQDCTAPIDLTNTVLEVSMWAKGKLKKDLLQSDTYFALADNIGFQQAAVGDIIVIDKVRSPEQMLITGFDENNNLIQVQRGYHGTPIYPYSRGTKLRIFRVLNAVGQTEMTLNNVLNVDGTVTQNVLTESKLAYNWSANDTCLPGCYLLEFKLLKMLTATSMAMSVGFGPNPISSISDIPISFISYTPNQMDCSIGAGVEWVRRFPVQNEGFLIQIYDTPTTESLVN